MRSKQNKAKIMAAYKSNSYRRFRISFSHTDPIILIALSLADAHRQATRLAKHIATLGRPIGHVSIIRDLGPIYTTRYHAHVPHHN